MALPIFEVTLAIIIFVDLFEIYLDIRQHRKFKERALPPQLKGIIQEKDFQEAQAYGHDKSTFSFVVSIKSEIEKLFSLFFFHPYLWSVSKETLFFFNLDSSYEITQSLIFSFYLMIFTTLLGIPLSLYSHFVIEQKHGFNKITLKLFIEDLVKTLLLSIVIGGPVLSGFLFLIQWGGESFYFYTTVGMFAFQMLLLWIYPTWIQPLFNKVEPLPEGALRTDVESLAKEVDFPLTALYQIDGSKRSDHSNAYMYGFFKNKRIVLFDTLMKQCSKEEIVAILGHELGHWKFSHTVQMLGLHQVRLFVIFYCFSLIIRSQEIYNQFGFHGEMPILIGFIIFGNLWTPIEFVLNFLQNILSRKFEYEADRFAVTLGRGEDLKSGLIAIHKENKSGLNLDPWYSTYHNSHPTLVERLRALNEAEKKNN